MAKHAAVLLAVLAFIFIPARAFASSAPGQPYRIGFQDRLVTDVYLNGQGPYTFLIDSASSRTIIFEHVRAALGLKPSQPDPIIVYGINRSAPAMAVAPERLTLAGQDIGGLTMGVLPDAEQNTDPDGVLGIDVLSRYLVVLDRASMRMELLPRDGEAARAYAGWDRLALTPHPLKNMAVTFWYVSTRFNGHIMPALFDLGSGMTLINWQAAERLGMEKRAATRRYGPPPDGLRDVLGDVAPALVLKMVKVGLSGQDWPHQDVLVSDAPVFDFFGMGDRPGAIVGPGLLKDNSLAVDFVGHRLYVGPAIKAD